MNELIDIIVTVYNKECTIKRCIDSILSQDYEYFNLIIIDDGSTDNSREICQAYDDSRIHYYYQNNSGVGNARNSGLNRCIGSKLVFVDADDYVSTSYLSNFLKYKEYELVVQGYTLCHVNGEQGKKIVPTECVIESEDYGERLFSKGIYEFMTMPWNKMFDTKLIKDNKIKFRNLTTGEDVCFIFDYLQYTKRVFLAPEYDYRYNLTDGSLTRKAIPDIWERKKDINDYCRKNYYSEYSETWATMYIRAIKRTLAEAGYDRRRFFLQIKKIRADVDFDKVNKKYLCNAIDKTMYFLIRINCPLLLWFMFQFV